MLNKTSLALLMTDPKIEIILLSLLFGSCPTVKDASGKGLTLTERGVRRETVLFLLSVQES